VHAAEDDDERRHCQNRSAEGRLSRPHERARFATAQRERSVRQDSGSENRASPIGMTLTELRVARPSRVMLTVRIRHDQIELIRVVAIVAAGIGGMGLERIIDKTKNKPDPFLKNRSLRIVFIPWDPIEGDEWARKTAQWNHVTGNKYEIVFHAKGALNPWIVKANDDPGAVIYIRGHGNPGVPYIQVKVDVGSDAPEERKILIVEACDRLIDMGLRPRFSGVIKFYHCYSGTILTEKTYMTEVIRLESLNETTQKAFDLGYITASKKNEYWKEIHDNKSIARTGADYMRKGGFRHCLYYGYLGPLASKYADDGMGFHKSVEIDGLQNAPGHLANATTVRASVGRVQV
jgi:hypothetical protein